MHIAILKGGWSAEREISLATGDAVKNALDSMGYHVSAIDVNKNIASVLQNINPDVVFNALHGRFGEDGRIQGMLEMLAIPYTHSGVLASALAMDKVVSQQIFMQNGLKCPKSVVVSPRELAENEPIPRPFVIKPINEGSSVGVEIIFPEDDWKFDAEKWTFGEKILVEEYIKGKEINVAIMGGRALGALEIKPLGRFYDYSTKYSENKAEHIIPANLPADVYQRALDIGLKAHNILGCQGVSRVEAIYNEEEDEFYMLEVNTQPGMTKTSLIPEIAAHAGVSFNELVEWLIKDAFERFKNV